MASARFRLSAALAAAAMTVGCSGTLAHKGAVIDTQMLGAIQPGVDNKASVEKVLGRPSFTGQFNPNDWYYYSRDTRQIGPRDPSVLKQTVLLIRFNPAGSVASIHRSGKEMVAGVDPSNRRTPTIGRERSFFEELFGGIGSVGAPMGRQ